jgi:hypothetical protein
MQFSMGRRFKLQLLRRYSVTQVGGEPTTPGSAASDSTPAPLLLVK